MIDPGGRFFGMSRSLAHTRDHVHHKIANSQSQIDDMSLRQYEGGMFSILRFVISFARVSRIIHFIGWLQAAYELNKVRKPLPPQGYDECPLSIMGDIGLL